ncbi:MAG TPA: peptidase domain-containing ABC transporter [Puia sp.]|nr:peptidase domain-containing ABC transporter [Puia sp.]
MLNFFKKRYVVQHQHDAMDCGPSCLKMIAGWYGKELSMDFLREKCYLSREGVSLLSIKDAADTIGFESLMVNLSFDRLKKDCPLPCILHWNQDHFVVLYDIRETRGDYRMTIADPAFGKLRINKETLEKSWMSTGEGKGIALLLEPSEQFESIPDVPEQKHGLRFLFSYLTAYRSMFLQLLLGVLAAGGLNLLAPFLTQSLVDTGIGGKDIRYVVYVLLAQVGIFLGELIIELARSWILLHVNTRVSLSIISDFLRKLMRLPIRTFDTKTIGDISQRIVDHNRIELFLTSVTMDSLFSILIIVISTVILAFYNLLILAVFLCSSVLAVAWVFFFQRRRLIFDYNRFQQRKSNQEKIYELVEGMQEVKLYGAELSKNLEWEEIQIRLFGLNVKALRLEQIQKVGFLFFTQLKNIIITFIAAWAVITGHLSLGAMLSISFILGQTNGPLSQIINLIRSAQDARISIERLQEIHLKDDEEKPYLGIPGGPAPAGDSCSDIRIENLTFRYEGPRSPTVLQNLSIDIPKGKVTAIVGASGSGKTTLMKLLLNFYQPNVGQILVNGYNLHDISPTEWRTKIGTVMQDGYLFSDTIARNIAIDGREIDPARFAHAVSVANLEEAVANFPMGYATKVGPNGVGISGGQRQRILIARAVYKNPDYLFFDEATSSLDSTNERRIMENLDEVFVDKTVIIIAHRLSTVTGADQIIVLDKGRVVETGNHERLTKVKGHYYHLIKNQLELGS